MEATAQAVSVLTLLDGPLPTPAEAHWPPSEELPSDAAFELSSPFFQPDQPGQALYLHRVVAPIRASRKIDEATALELMRWLNCQIVFHDNYRNEAALLLEDGLATCGGQARLLAGCLEAAGIPSRFLMVEGHCTTEALIDGRWRLLDAEFNGAFRRPDGGLYSALEVHERHRSGEPEVTTFGDRRYRSYTIVWPRGGGDYDEIWISPDDGPGSPAAQRAYPEPRA
jgi:transglutaminase-like putative cysteine protease